MTSKTETIHVVDKRRSYAGENASSRRAIPAGWRAHSVLLGYFGADNARRFLQDKALKPELVNELMQQREFAHTRIQSLPPVDTKKSSSRPLEDANALAEISRVMARPDCQGAYPEGTWTAELVEIANIIPIQPYLDLDYAGSLGDSDLAPSDPLTAVKLCFAEKHPTEFHVSVEESQKAINISGINPSLEVVGLRYEQQQNDGPVVLSFMVSPAPNIVSVPRYAGRHFLASGYHRVYRLMKLGFTHVPCAVSEAKTLPQIGMRGRALFSEAVLMAPRPPRFPDFADMVLGIVVPFKPMHRVVRIRPDEYFVSG